MQQNSEATFECVPVAIDAVNIIQFFDYQGQTKAVIAYLKENEEKTWAALALPEAFILSDKDHDATDKALLETEQAFGLKRASYKNGAAVEPAYTKIAQPYRLIYAHYTDGRAVNWEGAHRYVQEDASHKLYPTSPFVEGERIVADKEESFTTIVRLKPVELAILHKKALFNGNLADASRASRALLVPANCRKNQEAPAVK